MSKKKTTTTPTPMMPRSGRSWRIPTSPEIFWNASSGGVPAVVRPVHAEAGTPTFVEPDLHQYASDILWSVKPPGVKMAMFIRSSSTRAPKIVHAFPHVTLQCGGDAETSGEHKTLPLVIPVLFYHGERSPTRTA